MPSYDASRFNPPAPVAVVTLRIDNSEATVPNVLLLLDSGDGARSLAPVVLLDMHFLNRVFRGGYLVTEEQIGILGRDVLNHVTVLLDGPRQEWSEPSP
jgi:hypothetical protein